MRRWVGGMLRSGAAVGTDQQSPTRQGDGAPSHQVMTIVTRWWIDPGLITWLSAVTSLLLVEPTIVRHGGAGL